MNLSALFIYRPVATTLLTIGIALLGIAAFQFLPVSPMPEVDSPTIAVSASLPGASPETMAATVATPLERALGTIAGITEITSSSALGSTSVILQFDLSRDIDSAARDVQAAINAARSMLPSSLPNNPTYRKVNPADAPIMILALSSPTLTQGQLYDVASTLLAQKLSQVKGVGQVTVGGSSLPAVRIDLNPAALNQYGISLEDVRTAIAATNANGPLGSVSNHYNHWQIYANDQAMTAADYLPLIIRYQKPSNTSGTTNSLSSKADAVGIPVRLQDVARISDSIENIRNAGLMNGEPSILLVLRRQPGANVIETVDLITAMLPQLQTMIPASINMKVAMERTSTIRASLREVQQTLLISVALVIMVVFVFLRNVRSTLIPSVAVPVSLIGTFAAMYLFGFSLNNLSLMALTIATGFVVDDAIVVLENINRHIEGGMKPFQAALRGAREVGFTVLAMTLSLIAVFLPILLMGGIVGRLMQEFAITLSAAILISLVISLTMTPMMCAYLLRPTNKTQHGRLFLLSERFFTHMHNGYSSSLRWVLRHTKFIWFILLAMVVLNGYLYYYIPKGFFPTQDTGRMIGFIRADQATSFQLMSQKLGDMLRIVQADSAVENVVGFTGGGQSNTARIFVTLKSLKERNVTMQQVIGRLRPQLVQIPGARLFLIPAQDIRIGGRDSSSSYQFTLQADDLSILRAWEPKIRAALSNLDILEDIDTDVSDKGIQTEVTIDRDTAARLGVTPWQIEAVLNDAFGQRQVSTIYHPLNQYHVVMGLSGEYLQNPTALQDIYVITTQGSRVPLSAFSTLNPTNTSLSVNHQGQFAASTISFNLADGVSLSQATETINQLVARIGVPTSVQASFQGTARAFQDSLANQPILILAALLTIYIVLGILYESAIHPLTIISTLPSAGVGALLALIATDTDFSIIAFIGVILLIGIVKKNAIMMIDFALVAEREHNLAPQEAIFQACLLRFRPILMTTMAAMLGALPLALGQGDGAETRVPLGISIVGGLLLSQLLTLYTTPVVYLTFDRWALAWRNRRATTALSIESRSAS